MNVQQWAMLFIALASFDYAAATFFGSFDGVDESFAEGEDNTYYGWSGRCRCRDTLTKHLDNVLDRIRSNMGKSHELLDLSFGEYELKDGRVVGLNNCKRSSQYRCSSTDKYARIFFKISFLKLVVHYRLSLLENVLNNLLGGVGCLLSDILGNVSGFLFRVLLDAHVTVVLRVNFGGEIVLEGFNLAKIDELTFLNKRFSQNSGSLFPYVRALIDHVLRHCFLNDLKGHYRKSLETCTIRKRMFYYESKSDECEEDDCD